MIIFTSKIIKVNGRMCTLFIKIVIVDSPHMQRRKICFSCIYGNIIYQPLREWIDHACYCIITSMLENPFLIIHLDKYNQGSYVDFPMLKLTDASYNIIGYCLMNLFSSLSKLPSPNTIPFSSF